MPLSRRCARFASTSTRSLYNNHRQRQRRSGVPRRAPIQARLDETRHPFSLAIRAATASVSEDRQVDGESTVADRAAMRLGQSLRIALAAASISSGSVLAAHAGTNPCEPEILRAADRYKIPVGILYAVGL